ncbi:DUF5689 domain-containing protein [Myroides ceti]|uniref:DUF5689 domain-containing protein n=1 Tax=Paenimyroides ceti TaxID=395087 RepID=A0ABT8CW15_9FLAO|nr:DUF5689 domain-containing protein [Paenimyroides ceti]MDN3708722.1 DUF5689 domain-containing protein [Paenimyroides ceti]
MKARFLKAVLLLSLSAVITTSCASDDDFSIPNVDCVDPNITVTKTVQEIYAMATTTAVQYTEDDVIEAIVVSSDKGGNFYKKMYLNSVDGEKGFSVAINQAKLFSDYQPGRKVYIKLKNLYIQIRSNTLEIGALYNGNVGQIATLEYKSHVLRSCTTKPESELVHTLNLNEAINDAYLGKLVELQNVQFTDSSLGQNYYNAANVVGSETNHYITNSESEAIKLIFRTGQYAEYAGLPVSEKSGKIRGVLTKFNNDYQFVARYTSDIQLTETRIGGSPEGPGEPEQPEQPEQPGENAAPLFPGFNFEDFAAFTGSLNSFGLQAYATQSAGTGIDNSTSLRINTTGAAGNDYVFTTLYNSAIPANATKIQFYVKGTAAKGISLNVYKQGTGYFAFNLGDLTTSATFSVAENNQYAGSVNTNGQWVLVTLDISSLTGLQSTVGGNFFALKIGKEAAYDVHFDNFTIE